MTSLSFENIGRVANVKSRVNMPMIVFCVLAFAFGVALTLFASSNTNEGMGMTGLFVGVLIVIASVAVMFSKRKQWIYVPTGSPLYSESVEMGMESLKGLRKRLVQIDSEAEKMFASADNGRVLFESIYATDGSFAAFQISQYTALMYVPIMEIRCLTGSQALGFVELLRKEIYRKS